MRLVSLTCSNTEIVWALGCLDWLVGVDDHSDYPPEVARLPRVGPDLQVDLDRVEALKPDLVLASLSVPGMERVVEGLQARRIPHLVLDPQSLQEVYDDILRVAQALGVTQRGSMVVQAMQQMLAQARGSLPRWVRPPRVMVEWWPRPMIAAGRQSWVTGLLEALGAKNAFDHLPVRSKPLTPAEVEEAQPDAIVVSWCGARKLRPELVLRRELDVPALQHRQVFAVEEAYLGRPGPRLAEGARRLAEALRGVLVFAQAGWGRTE
ncbi:MAG: cobalamin-binding protein [Meiothermus sp.]|uniref:cobalamin-binding protein n=1 Tax=Meiothermus sp. TaxID=1955249 RepID=UPI0025CE7215|nr:cobalamin-binding protein [Meiothermus sp.]MCS7195174.1 cobalamin-binding protein [Meiothermus sp.]MDW8091699.1 cobalamin-binding protein [Meiothermus sp.]